MKKLIEKIDGYSIKHDDENGKFLVFLGRKNVGIFDLLQDAQQGAKQHKELVEISRSLMMPKRK